MLVKLSSSLGADRSFSLSLGPCMSEMAALSCGVPQGSVLGPILFAIYTLPLGHIISKFKGISCHCFADDIQLYVSFKPDDTDKLTVLYTIAIKDWMASFLQLNTDKTDSLSLVQIASIPRSLSLFGPFR